VSVYKYDEKTCPTCKRAALVRGADGGWSCVEKRKGCGKVWPADTAAIAGQKHETWRYRKVVTLADGTKQRVAGTAPINTRVSAERAEREHIERVLNPPKRARERLTMSLLFEKLLDEYALNKNNKPSEIESKRSAIERYLEPELGALYIDEVTEARLSELTAKFGRTKKANGETLSAKTVRNVLQVLRRSLTWAEHMHWIDHAPVVDMPRIDEPEMEYLRDEQLAALLAAAAAEPKWYAAVLLAADAGLRLGELRALRWTDINEVTNKIVVSRSRWRQDEGSPKSRKSRSVDISRRLRDALTALRAICRGDYVLSRDDGQPYGTEHMSATINRLAQKAKLDQRGWHMLRHTFCTRLATKGAPVTTIKELAGHANLATTMRYMHVVPGSTARAIALLDDDDGTSDEVVVLDALRRLAAAAQPRGRHGSEVTAPTGTQGRVLTILRTTGPTGCMPDGADELAAAGGGSR
jgi:integrase